MANTLQLKNDIKKLKGALTSKNLTASFKEKIKNQLQKAENELKATQSGAPARKVSTTKSTKTTLDKLKAQIEKKGYGVYKNAGVDLQKDAKEPAMRVGKRYSQGLKANQHGSKKENKGNVYYEYRANRLDVKQPSKSAKYPKLEDGGMMANGGEIKKVTDGDDTYYLTYIDSTHFYLSNSKDYKGNAFHIAEFRSRPFYNEVKSWLKSNNNKMAYGGMTDSEYTRKKDQVVDYYLDNDVYDDPESYGLQEEDLKNLKKVEDAIIRKWELHLADNVQERFEVLGFEDFDEDDDDDDDDDNYAKGGRVKKYELGDMWSPDFNYNGMLKMGMNSRISWGVDKLQALSDSFEDVNYHSENIKLIEAIDYLKKGDEVKARQALGTFNLLCRSQLGQQAFQDEMADGGMMANGGRLKELLSKAKSLSAKGYEKAKHYGKKGYDKTKEYTKKQIHDQKKKIALDVIDETIYNYRNDKNEFRQHLAAAEELIEEGYAKGGYMAEGGFTNKEAYELVKNKVKGGIWEQNALNILRNDAMAKPDQMFKPTGDVELLEKYMEKGGGYMAKGGVIGTYRIYPFKTYDRYVLNDANYDLAFTIEGTLDEAIKKAQEYVLVNKLYAAHITKEQYGLPLKMQTILASVSKDNVLNYTLPYADGGMMAEGGELNYNSINFPTKNETEESAKNWLNELIKEKGRNEAAKIVRYNLTGKNPYYKYNNIYDQWLSSATLNEQYAKGGVTEKEVVDSNAQMVLSQIKAVKHHADELSNIVSMKSDIEAWVVAKIERASTDLSDITHYLDGQHDKMSMGGSVYNHAHKMDKK